MTEKGKRTDSYKSFVRPCQVISVFTATIYGKWPSCLVRMRTLYSVEMGYFTYVCVYIYIYNVHVCHVNERCRRKEERRKVIQTTRQTTHPRQSCKSDCLGCAVLLCLIVCLTLLASFFLPSHLSLSSFLLHLSLTCTSSIQITPQCAECFP